MPLFFQYSTQICKIDQFVSGEKSIVILFFFFSVHILISGYIQCHIFAGSLTLPLSHPPTLLEVSSAGVSRASPAPHILLGKIRRKSFQGGDGHLGPKVHLLEDAIKPKLELKHCSRNN